MKRVRVPDVLGVIARKCNVLADEVSAGAAPAVSSRSWPSSAAVSLGHTGVKAAGEAMTTRMETTATLIDGARVAYPLKRGEVRNLGPVAGTGSGTKGLGAGGADLMEITPDGTTAIGGDTYTGDGNSQGNWSRSQAFGVKPGSLGDPDGVKFDRTFGNNNDLYADPLAPGATTQLPAGTIMVNGKTYAMVDNTKWDNGLVPVNSRLVEVDPNNPGWKTVPGSVQPGGYAGGYQTQISGFQANDGTVYIVADGQGRNNEPVLYRANPDTFTDRSTWQPMSRDGAGKPVWNAGGQPAPLSPDKWGEVSMRQIDGKTVLSGFNESTGRVEVHVVDDPTQLFTGNDKLTVVATPQDVPQNYGGYIVPGSSLDSMKILVSQWHGGTYNVQEFEANVNR